MRRNPVRFAGFRCRAGHGPAPTMARRNHSGAADMGGPVLAEHMNVFPTGLLPPSAYIRQTGPACTRNSGDAPANALHRVGAAAMPGPCRTRKSGDAPTDTPHPVGAAAMPGPSRIRNSGNAPCDAMHRVGNAFMRSEIYRFAPEPGVFCGPLLPGRAWPGPYMAWRNHSGAAYMGGAVFYAAWRGGAVARRWRRARSAAMGATAAAP